MVDDEKALEKMWSLRNELPSVKRIVMYVGKPDKNLYPDVLSWDELKALGKNQTGQGLEERLANIAINQCCTLVYTSGTTGNPKGVMLSHDNLYWTGMAAHDCKSLIFHTILKVKCLSKNLILTKPQHLHEFSPKIF